MKFEKEIELIGDASDFLSKLNKGEDIFDVISNDVPGIKILVKISNSISDKIFNMKVDKFISYANNSHTDNNFEQFKTRMQNNSTYKNKVSNYLLFKINKLDVDYKLEIFAKACVDFFQGVINYDDLVNISECIDMISEKDISILKHIDKNNKFIPENIKIENTSCESIHSSLSKFHMSSILERTGIVLLNEFPEDPVVGQIGPDVTASYSLSSLGKKFIKYL